MPDVQLMRGVLKALNAIVSADSGPAARPRRAIYAVTAVLGVSSFVALRACDDILKALHPAGEFSYGMRDLSDVGLHLPSIDVPRNARLTWLNAAVASAGETGPLRLVGTYLVIDLVFILAYATLLALLFKRAELRLSRPTPPRKGSARAARLRIATIGFRFGVPLLLIADVVENVATALLIPALVTNEPPRFVSWQRFGLADESLFWIFALAAYLKWAFAAFVLVALAVLVGALLLGKWESAGRADEDDRSEPRRSTVAKAITTVATLRVQALLVVLFALFLLGPTSKDQGADVMLRWNPPAEDWLDGVAAVLLTAWFGLVTYTVGERLLRFAAGKTRRTIGLTGLWLMCGAGLGLTVAGGVSMWRLDRLEGLLVLGIVTGSIGALSLIIGSIDTDDPKESGAGSSALPPLLSVLPLVLLGVAMLDAALAEVIFSRRPEFLALVIFGVLLQLAGWGFYAFLRRRGDRHPGQGQPIEQWWEPVVLWGSLALAGGFTIWVWFDPHAAGGAFGVMGSLATFAMLVSLLGYVALRIEQEWRPPSCFRLLGLKRIPIFALVALVFLAGSAADPGGYHDVRTIDYGGPTSGHFQVHYATAWTRWLGTQKLERRDQPASGSGVDVVPLVFIAAEGGGIRAAYWTARVLDCVYAREPADCGGMANPNARTAPPPFVESGVSGGSLGLVQHLAHRVARVDDADDDWVKKRIGGDQLAGTSAWTLFVDLPNALLRVDPGQDRAEVLEEAWERAWDRTSDGRPATVNPMRRGFFDISRSSVPLLLLNGTSVQDGCRVNTSVLNGDIESLETADAEERLRDCLTLRAYESDTAKPQGARARWAFGATQDLVELLCPRKDVPLSTAALLSARFPFVTPAARVPHCRNPDLATFVVDGGYFDTSASSTIVELWAKVQPLVLDFNRSSSTHCVVPLMLQIDNHYTEPRAVSETKRSPELFVPLEAVSAARNAREHNARHAAALAFDGPFGRHARIRLETTTDAESVESEIDRYAHIYPRAHPGTKAPLGWALSEAAMNDLTKQLGGPANRKEFEKVWSWFDPALRCEVSPGSPAPPGTR